MGWIRLCGWRDFCSIYFFVMNFGKNYGGGVIPLVVGFVFEICWGGCVFYVLFLHG